MDWKEIYEQKKNGTASPSTPSLAWNTPSGGDWRSIYEQKKNAKGTDLNAWTSAVNTLVSDFNTNSSSWEKEGKGISEYKAERANLISYADNFRSQYADNQEALSYIDEVLGVLNGLPEKIHYDSYDEYWREKYQGKSREELESIIKDMEEGDEQNWLREYSLSPDVMTVAEYERELSTLIPVLEQAKQYENEMGRYVSGAGQDESLYLRALTKQDSLLKKYGYSDIDELEQDVEKYSAGKWTAERREKYGSIQNNSDFEALSGTVAEKPTAGFGIGFGTSWWGKGDPVYDYINDIDGTRAKSFNATTLSSGPYTIYDYMDEDEIEIYNYLYNTEGKEAAGEYLDYLEYGLNERRTQKVAENAELMADKHPVISSILSVPANLVSGIGLVDAIAQDVKRDVTGEYRPIDYNRGTMAPSTVSSTIRGTVAQNIAGSTGTINLDTNKHPHLSRWLNGKSLGDLYQLGMSMADSMAVAYLTPLGAYGTFLLGGSAGTQGMLDALAKGATDEQAITMGVINGAFETLFEYVSLDKLLKGDTRNIIKAFFAQGFVEGTEEANTTFFNNMADILVMAEKSDYRQNIQAYMDAGLSEEQATKEALKDKGIELFWDFIGGAVSGGIMGSTSTAVRDVQQNTEAKKIYGGGVSALAEEALELDPNNKLAQKVQENASSGKRVWGNQLYNLVQQNEAAMRGQDIAKIQEAVSQRLHELGEVGDVTAISQAIARQTAGEKLSRAEQQTLRESKYGSRVLNELSPENINNGLYPYAWTGKIGTERINAEEYSRLIASAEDVQNGAEITQESVETAQEEAEIIPTNDAAIAPEAAQTSPVKATEENTANAQAVTEEPKATIEEASKKYGAQAGAMLHTYNRGQDVDEFDAAYQIAHEMGRSGVSLDYTMNSNAVRYLTDEQKKLAYMAGRDASALAAKAREEKIGKGTNGRTGWRKGVVRGEGVTGNDLQEAFHMNDSQVRAYNILSTIAEATGIDIVLYKSTVNAEGKYQGAQGKYRKSEPGTIYLDLNAGLEDIKSAADLQKYALLRSFGHEFTHFIENWNPVQYNEFRRLVFDTIDQRRGEKGYSADELIGIKMEQNPGMGYEAASREVVAEAMTDILPDSRFVQELAEKHKSIFNKLLDKLKEFAARIKEVFANLGDNPSREARALKEQAGESLRYVENIVKMFDDIAVQAVENYQSNYAVEEASQEAKTEAVTEEDDFSDINPEEIRKALEESAGKPSPFVERVMADVKRLAEKPEPKVTTSENGFTVTDNPDYGSIEVKFSEKPSEAIRDVLKANKFRWNGKRQVWYGKTTHETIREALDKAYAEEKADKTKPFFGDSIFNAEAVNSIVGDKANGKQNPAADIIDKLPKSDFETAFWNATQEERDEVIDAIDKNMGKPSRMYPTEIREAPENKKEENKNGSESEIDGRAVQQPESDGNGASRILEEVQAEDVQGTGGQREAVAPDKERGGQAERDGDRTDAADRTGRRERDGQSGDLRRDELSQEEKQAKKTKLKEIVIDLTAQQSTEKPKGSNFVIGESLNLPSGEKARFQANVEAIRLIKKLEDEGRNATAAEQEVLSKYVGWGGLSNAFGELKYNRELRKSEMVAKPGWEKEFSAFRQLVEDGIITEEEYKAMSASTKNAHYTSIEVIKAMYDGLAQLGFTGGRMLEPSAGVGNFVGAMPAGMSRSVKSWTMVELDRITGQIAKYLYPQADVRIQGFETANIPDNYMDVAIGNVPFGNYGVADRNYPKRITRAIHNYFFAKTLDKVRPGGLVMFITSSFTMNGQDTSIRQYIMDRADLLGAIRLPNTAFSGNAGTQVVTDILVLKKRAKGTEYAGESFLEAPGRSIDGSWQYVNINEYFDNHPEMVLGTAALDRGMYGANSLTYKPLEGKGSLGEQIREAFKNIKGKMDYTAQQTPEKANFAVERAKEKTKNHGLEVKEDGKVYRNVDGKLEVISEDKATAERISGLLGIRDAYRRLVNYLQQGLSEPEISKARNALNKAYDDFVKKYGPINAQKNKAAIAEDPDSYSLLSLENYDAKKKTATKADIFTKDTITANKTFRNVDSVAEGVIVSINRTGGIDAALIARITGKTEEAVTRELIDSRMAFKTRDGGLEAPDTYLSGNVRAKLRDAEAMAPIDKDFQNNVEELRRVIPKDIPFNDIYAAVGTPWVPNNVYADFIAEMLGGYNSENSYRGPDVTVGRTNTGEFKIVLNNARLKGGFQNTQKWGTSRKSFLDIMTALMSSTGIKVNDYIEDENGRRKPVLNKVETAAAQEKAEEIQKEFQEWLWKDESRRKELSTLYNDTFNALVTPKYNGANLTINGLNAEFDLREHQADAVQRIISSGGNTLLAHKVGAGKTLEMAAAAMKLRELGIVKKPMFVVPKALVAQWGVEFKSYFPAARLLVSDEKSFTKANRMTYANRIANGDFDAVILSYEQFEKIPMSAAYRQEFYQQQIDEIIDAIAEEKAESNGKGITVKEMEKKKAQLEKKIAELTTKSKDEDNIDFEQLGVDSLFVDEAHNFKNLQYTTRMKNISGLGNADGSQRAFDLYTKVRYLQGMNGGRGIVFATATPVMNSMAEMYIMQKYLQSDMLEQLGLKTFDAWAKQFGEVVNSVEIKPSGQGFRVKQTFSNFRNLNELQLLFRSFSDVLTQVPGLKIPRMKGGKVHTVVCEPGQFQKDYMAELEKRADNVKNVDPSEDNMLKITSDGRKVSYTQRMIDPTLPYEPGCKIYRCCENVLAEYKESTGKKVLDPKTEEMVDLLGTQIIFCDMATPKGKSMTAGTEETDDTELDTSSAKLYDDMRAYLVKRGIPAKEIAFIHEADTDAKKKQLFADVNDGKVRVLIGSTGKMGVGMNAQKRIVAIHHLDAPWRPGDVEQRDGRAFRQGNLNEEVTKYTYVTEGSFDARLWDILERKQHFISQIMNGEDVGRNAEDTGEVTLSAAEVKALASGNDMVKEQVRLVNDLSKLQDLRRAYNSSITAAKARLLEDEQKIKTLENTIAKLKEDIKDRVDTYSEGKFSMTAGKRTFTEKKGAGAALAAEIMAKAKQGEFVTVGKFAGFELRVMKDGAEYRGLISGRQGYKFNVYTENTTYMVNHIIGVIDGFETKRKNYSERLADLRTDMDAQETIISTPFSRQAELEQKMARYNEVMAILNPKEEQTIADDEQEQSRAYLSDEAEAFREDIDNWDNSERPDGETFILGSTGNVFRGLGAIESDVYMLSDKVNTIFNDHPEMTIKEIKNLPEILENPVMVLASRNLGRGGQNNTRLTVFGMVKAQNGLPVMVVFDLHPVENKIYLDDMQKVASAYTKDGSPKAAMSLMKNSDVLYADKDKAASLLHTVGFHNAYRIEQSGYVGNISYEDDQVKISGKKFSDVFTDETEQSQQRTNTLTDREVLQYAASELSMDKLTDGERDALKIFNERLSKLEELQEKRAEQGRLYREQQFGAKVDREAAKATHNRMQVLDEQIKRASEAVLSVEDKAVLKRVLQKARKVVEQQEREKGQEILRRWRDRRNNAAAIKKYRERIRGDVDELTRWVLHPNNKDAVKHIPDALKNTVIPFLTSIDFTSKQQLRGGNATKADAEFMKKLNALKGALKQNMDLNGLYSGYNDLPPDFMENLQTFIDSAQAIVEKNSGEYVINRMTSEELRELSKVVRTLKKYITQMNRFHANAMYQHVYEAGDNSIEYMGQIGNADNTGPVSNFMLWQQIRPAYAFERFGEGGMAIYDGLRRGQATLAFNTQKIKEFADKAYTAEEVKAWEKEVKSFRLGSDDVKIPVSDIMSLYELSLRPQALGHILGKGIRVATYKDGKAKISDLGHTLTSEELNQIISSLTPRQREVANALQRFMAKQGGEWGNYVSVRRFGEEMFGEEHYFPIHSDGRHLQAKAEEHPSAASLYALLNMSFTKELKEEANNRIVLYSIFDVFANHMASMAQYNAFALPVLDALKWFNYQQVAVNEDGSKDILGSVREQMDRVYGVPEEKRPGSGRQGYAESFVINIIKAFNGTEAQGVPMDEFGLKTLRRYNMAQVAFNFRVVVQQPCAITRAGLLVDYRSIIKGMRLSRSAISQNIEEMQKYSGIAAWKSLGFYDINISRGLTDIIKHKNTALDKIGDIGMWGAEKADLLTWAGIWSACKEEVTRKQGIRPGAAGFYEAVTKLFEDVIYKTQVVDSVLTKNEFLRSKGFWARAVGSFMSEPTTTASMLIDAYDRFSTDMQRGMSRQEAWKKNRGMIGRTAYVYAVGAILLAVVQAAADALRDDDDYESFWEKLLEAFGGNIVEEINPVNKLPVFSDLWEVFKEMLSTWGVDTYGNPPRSVLMQWYDSLIKASDILHDKVTGQESNYGWYAFIYKTLQVASGISGLPMAAATREIITAWNNIVGFFAPSLKLKTYEPSEQAQIKYAYQDGYLTAEEATEQLMEQGLVENENEAYWLIQGWEAGDDYSRFDELYDAVRNGGDFKGAMDELTAHGYTEKDIISKVKSQIGQWYKDGEVSKTQAVSMLTKYGEMSAEDITRQVNKWSSVVVTGIEYDDIKDEYLAGNITASRAAEMYVKYGGLSQNEAELKVKVFEWQKEVPNCDEITTSAIKDYDEIAGPAGISREVYYNAWVEYKDTPADYDEKGESIPYSKTRKVMPLINALPLTADQKTALALCWWSEATVRKYKLW